MESGRGRLTLDAWLSAELPQRFEGRIFGINESVAAAWGEIVAARELMGQPIAASSSFPRAFGGNPGSLFWRCTIAISCTLHKCRLDPRLKHSGMTICQFEWHLLASLSLNLINSCGMLQYDEVCCALSNRRP